MKPADVLSPDPAGGTESGGSWVAGLVPNAIALRCLSVELRAAREIVVGEPAKFVLRVRNRSPIPVSVRLPTSRLWGWEVDGIPDADERRFEPPESPRRVAFPRRGIRQFEGTWDGQIRRSGIDGDEWRPEPGVHTLTGYLATGKNASNLRDSVQVNVSNG
ncbi:hypothetical protein ACFFQF_11185 [Haladaptatus pallidirubidus]|uniref:DUF7974 domain-containing protein n=1 Tax=Haladaptatus pallidirubidus TaxID=1008152 RepID=A0AAV3UF32_9EURY|nr:hypothetical protein [Haladaptatus pallidirubidus]